MLDPILPDHKLPQSNGTNETMASHGPRVLLLTSTLGSGHLRAAYALKAALLEHSPSSIVQLIDFWSLMDASVAHRMQQVYLLLVQERPELYGELYQLDQHTWRNLLESNEGLSTILADDLELLAAVVEEDARPEPGGGRRRALDRLLFRLLCAVLAKRTVIKRRSLGNSTVRWGQWRGRLALTLIKLGWARLAWRLDTHLRSFAPDVVVITQVHPAALSSFVKQRRGLTTPLIGVLTDFGMHDFWIQPGINCYCVAHDSIVNALAADDGKTGRISVTGIPLMPGFREPPSQREARLRLGLDPDVPVVLVLGGGLGLGVDTVAARLLASLAWVRVLVLAGRNASALEKINELSTRYPGRISGWDWTEQTEVFISAADVVIGKPGGLTVAEALACGRPLLATSSLRGQESFNVSFLERHGVGRLLPEDDLPAAVESLLANPDELAGIQRLAQTLGRRDGARQIAQKVLTLAQAPGPPRIQAGWVRQITQRAMLRVDDLYHNWHRLHPVGDILYVGRSRYRGPTMELADGTRLAPGDLMGVLHFNNSTFLRIEAGTSRRVALRFRRLMLESMQILADLARRDPRFSDLAVYHAVSWVGPHGQRVGFFTQPFPDGLRKRLLATYFRFLVWVFAPAIQTRTSAKPDPTIYWLTRKQLLRRFSDGCDHAQAVKNNDNNG